MEDRVAGLVSAARLGHQDALQGLYDECQPMIYRLLVRMAGTQDAADLTQQVFLQAFRQLNQFSGRSTFQTWLYRLAVNESLQHLRRRDRHKTHRLQHEPPDRGREHADRLEQSELLERALSMIDRDNPERSPLFMKPLERAAGGAGHEGTDLFGRDVYAARWLVQQQQLWPRLQPLRDGHLLLVPARERTHLCVQ